MARILEAANVLRAAGLTVVEVSGWRTRGRELAGIRGGVAHHTATAATARGDYPTLGLVRDGRAGVPGPLSQLGLGRSGTWYVIASGRANHAGVVHTRFKATHSNEYSIGVEAEHPGRGAWSTTQYDAYVRGCAALGHHYGIAWYGHREVAAPAGRKVDPTFDMTVFRASVTATQASLSKPGGGNLPTVPVGTLPNPIPEAPDMTPAELRATLLSFFAEAAAGSTPQGRDFRNAVTSVITPSVWAHPTPAAILQAIAGLDGADVDEQALAVALAPQLAPLLSMLPDADLERIAEAVNDEASARLAQR